MNENVIKLKRDIQKQKDSWNERSQFRLKGVSNLSMADLDQIEMYADEYDRNFGTFGNLMRPLGSVREVLSKYNIIEEF